MGLIIKIAVLRICPICEKCGTACSLALRYQDTVRIHVETALLRQATCMVFDDIVQIDSKSYGNTKQMTNPEIGSGIHLI